MPGTLFTATLTVVDTETGESGAAAYPVMMREKNLASEVNVAIDEGLWYLHKTMSRTAIGNAAAGTWQSGAANASNVLAFERSGHLESGDSADPYTETVAWALKTLFAQLDTNPTPDSDWTAAVAAAGTPNARAADGRTCGQILQDLAAPGNDANLGW